MKRNRKPILTFDCPHCGKPVRENASACPHCGSDDETGWSLDNDEYVEDEFDYDDFIHKEFPKESERSGARFGKKELWTIIVIALLATMILPLFL